MELGLGATLAAAVVVTRFIGVIDTAHDGRVSATWFDVAVGLTFVGTLAAAFAARRPWLLTALAGITLAVCNGVWVGRVVALIATVMAGLAIACAASLASQPDHRS